MITAAQLKTRFDGKVTRKGRQAYTATPTGEKITILPSKGLSYGGGQYFLSDALAGPSGHISEDQAAADLTLIFDLYKEKHTSVKTDSRWQHMYLCKNRPFTFVKPDGNDTVMQLKAYPCHFCGMILPEGYIQVDHRQPQASPGVAVLKVLHSLTGAYTTGKGKGVKARAVGDIVAAPSVAFTAPLQAAVGKLPTVPPKGLVTGAFFNPVYLPANQAKLDRYTITAEGETFLSLGEMYLDDMQKYCINSLLNLVPACPSCNSTAAKGAKIHATGIPQVYPT